jgi:hypothetical protein
MPSLPLQFVNAQTPDATSSSHRRSRENSRNFASCSRVLPHPSVNREAGRDTPTAYGDAETNRRALAGGADALLTKPIDFVVVTDSVFDSDVRRRREFRVHPAGGTMSKREPQIGGLKLWAVMFLCPSERSDEAARGLTFGPRIEGAAPKEWQSSSGQVAVE